MKKKISILLALAVILTMTFSIAGCGASSEKQGASSEPKEFKIGLECGYAPFNWTQTDNRNGAVQISGSKDFAGGYDIEIAKKIADGLGRKLVIVKTKWDGLLPALQSGVIDAIIAGMSPTAERKKEIDFTDNYYRSNLVMVVRKGSIYENAKSIQDFKGAKITAQQSTFHYTVIDQIKGVVKKPAMASFPVMRAALESKAIDGYVSERPEGVSASSANPNFVMVEFPEDSGFQVSDDDVAVAVGLKKGQPELISKINEILKGISEEQRKEIMDTAIKNQPAAD